VFAVLVRMVRSFWRFILRVIELASAILTIVGVYLILQQVDWAGLARFFHLP
jgi:hypothetical protein